MNNDQDINRDKHFCDYCNTEYRCPEKVKCMASYHTPHAKCLFFLGTRKLKETLITLSQCLEIIFKSAILVVRGYLKTSKGEEF